MTNLERLRHEVGWSVRRLALESKVDRKPIFTIEASKGQKTYTGTYWKIAVALAKALGRDEEEVYKLLLEDKKRGI